MQDPARYINELGIKLNCSVDPSTPAKIESDYFVAIGFESFFFADSANLLKFLDDIPVYCGQLTDPISRERFSPDGNSPNYEFMGQLFFFTSAANRSVFENMPLMYNFPNYKMLPKDSIEEDILTL